jgi:hypothetical protein
MKRFQIAIVFGLFFSLSGTICSQSQHLKPGELTILHGYLVCLEEHRAKLEPGNDVVPSRRRTVLFFEDSLKIPNQLFDVKNKLSSDNWEEFVCLLSQAATATLFVFFGSDPISFEIHQDHDGVEWGMQLERNGRFITQFDSLQYRQMVETMFQSKPWSAYVPQGVQDDGGAYIAYLKADFQSMYLGETDNQCLGSKGTRMEYVFLPDPKDIFGFIGAFLVQ